MKFNIRGFRSWVTVSLFIVGIIVCLAALMRAWIAEGIREGMNAADNKRIQEAEARPKLDFDSSVWAASDGRSHGDTRYRMMNSLVAQHGLVGLSESEVVSLLGPPRKKPRAGWDMTFWLGPQPVMDNYHLSLKLQDGIVETYVVWGD